MTATRLPARSTSWSQRAEWKIAPWKPSMPSISGSLGSESPPDPLISVVAVTSPRLVRTTPALRLLVVRRLLQRRCRRRSGRARRTRGRPGAGRRGSRAGARTTATSRGWARRRRSRAGWGRRRRRRGRCWRATCRRRRESFSMTRKSVSPASSSLIAMPSPAKPAPTTRWVTAVGRVRMVGNVLALLAPRAGRTRGITGRPVIGGFAHTAACANPLERAPTSGRLSVAGSVTESVVSPGRLARVTVPPCAPTIARTSASPSPAPPSRCRAASPRTNRSKACSATSGGEPGPSSCTSKPSGRAVTVTVVPGGVYLRALVSRLVDHLVQPLLVADDLDRLVGQREPPGVVGRDDPGVVDRLHQQAATGRRARGPAAGRRRAGRAAAGPRPGRSSAPPRPRPCPARWPGASGWRRASSV